MTSFPASPKLAPVFSGPNPSEPNDHTESVAARIGVWKREVRKSRTRTL